MSIVNISSENQKARPKNHAEFSIKLQKPIQRVIGVQLLNATVPLSYDIINADDDKLYLPGGSGAVTLKHGTYDIDALCKMAEKEINATIISHFKATEDPSTVNLYSSLGSPTSISVAERYSDRTESFRDLCIANKRTYFSIDLVNGDTIDGPTKGLISIDPQRIKPGWLFAGSSYADGFIRRIEYIRQEKIVWTRQNEGAETTFYIFGLEFQGDTKEEYIFDPDSLGKTYASPYTTTNVGSGFIVYPGLLIYHDIDANKIMFQSHLQHLTPNIKPIGNSRRMLKTFGLTTDVEVTSHPILPAEEHPQIGGAKFTFESSHAPEPQGPGMLYLRLGGDILLDQQNSETHMNDRIPIPLNENHGSIVHHEKGMDAEIIPLSVPCDMTTISFRLEYGDDNEIIGGKAANLRGHESYFRLKFYKEHQQSII